MGDHAIVRDDATSETTRLHRRSLVRAGATAAWTVPVVAMAAPAQAASCSGGSTTLTAVKVGTTSQSGKPKLTVTLQVQVGNTGQSQSCALAATVTAQEASSKLNAFSVGTWTPAAVGGGGATSLTTVAPANEQLGAGQYTTYPVTYQLHDGSGTHTVTITFRTDNGASSSVSVTTNSK
jgi:hypothetical protein